MMNDAVLIWREALRSGYACADDVVQWVDRQIIAIDEPPNWMFDLSLSHDATETLSVLSRASSQIAKDVWARLSVHRLYIGFLYLRHERGELSVFDLLIKAGQEADCRDCGVGCEAFYLLANEIDGGGPVKPSSLPLPERVAKLFMPFANAAHSQWQRITSNVA